METYWLRFLDVTKSFEYAPREIISFRDAVSDLKSQNFNKFNISEHDLIEDAKDRRLTVLMRTTFRTPESKLSKLNH